MSKRKQALIIGLTILAMMLSILLVDGIFFANKRVRVKHYNFTHEKVTETLDGLKIVYFSDVHYNLYMDSDRFDKIVKLINQQKPDVVLLGGDVIDHEDTDLLTQEDIAYLIDSLGLIDAPFGKFAVSGTQELVSDYAQTTIRQILQLAEFELIDDQIFKIFYHEEFFNLAGVLSDEVLNDMNSIDKSKLNIAFTHQPKNADIIKNHGFDLMMAGYTHGGQINLPIFKKVFFNDQPYIKDSQKLGNLQLDISHGVGTSNIDVRMFADGDILVYTLRQSQK